MLAFGFLLFAGAPADAGDDAYRDKIRQMLDRGCKPGPSGLQAAEAAYRAAAGVRPDDPWLEYAWGLVLLRQFRHGDATEQFQAATELPGSPHWPAWRALVWCRLAADEFDAGTAAISQFADRLADAEGDVQARTENAVWLGRLLAALEITSERADHKKRLVELDLQFREQFAPELRKAYESGKPQSWEKQAELIQEINALRAAAIKSNAQAKEQTREAIEDGLQELTENKETVATTAEQWKEWLADQKKECDENLIALKKDREYLKRRAASVQQSIVALGVEYSAREVLVDANRGRGRPVQRVDFLRLQQEQQWLGYQMELLATLNEMRLIEQRVAAVLARRRAAAARYASEIDRLRRTKQGLDGRAGTLLQKIKNVDEQPLDRSPELTARMRRIKQLSTYVDLEPDAERTRILKSLGLLQ